MRRCCRSRQLRQRAWELWTPALLRPALWLDAADHSTITIATGVSEWRDKSGSGRNATQTTPSAQPSYVLGGLNNLNVIRFDGSNDVLSHNLNASPAPTTVFSVVNRRSGGFGDYQLIFQAVSPSSAFGANISAKASGISQWGSYINSWASGGSILSVGNAAIVGNVSPTATSGTELYRTNGTQTAAVSYASRYAGDAANRRAIGADPAHSGGWFSGDIGEIIVFLSVLSTSNCKLIEGYLAWKWGTYQYLPGDHPFKLRTPLVGD